MAEANAAQKHNCGTCTEQLKDDDTSLQCDGGCMKWHHKECAGITTGEFEILKRKNCKLLWLCDTCKCNIVRNKENQKSESENLNQKIDSIINFITNQLGTEIEKTVKKIIKEDGHPTLQSPTLRRETETSIVDKTDINKGSEDHVVLTANEREGTEEVIEATNDKPEQSHTESEQWSQVIRRKGRAPPPPPRRDPQVYGTKEETGDLQAAIKMAWLFVGRLRDNTTADTLKTYLQKNGITDSIECEELQTRGRNKAFRLGIPYSHLPQVELPEFWPKGVRVGRFQFRSFRGVDLNA